MPESLKNLFLLDPSIHFLNHGSFGACPEPVFAAYQTWQRRLEAQPVLFLGRQYDAFLQQARHELGVFLGVDGDDLALVPNVTYAVNLLARTLRLNPGDEILTSNHEYGACNFAWEFACRSTGAVYVQQPIPLPVSSSAEILDQFWKGVTPRTRVIYLSHVSSPTALCLPVEAVCARARRAGILTIIDGAHAPGQMPLDLKAVDADFYTGNCHKWMLSPKGAGFLYVRREMQHLIEPLVVSWGYHSLPEKSAGSTFLDYLTWSGTHDPAAYLSVPAAIQFMQAHNWEQVRQDCHALLRTTIERISLLLGTPLLYPLDSNLYHQMGIAALPQESDLTVLKNRLYDDFCVELPLIEWEGCKFMRISVQGYNTQQDLDALEEGLKKLLLNY